MKLKLDTGLYFFSSFLGRDICLNCDLTRGSLTFWGDVLFSIDMLITPVMGVLSMSRQFFRTIIRMESRSHDLDDKTIISSSSVARSFWFSFYTDGLFGTLSVNLEQTLQFIHNIFWEMVTNWFRWCEFWQSRGWNYLQNVTYGFPWATSIVRIFWSSIS